MTRIQEMYLKIPAFKCKEGCYECCDNMIQFAKEERARMPKADWNESLCPYLCDTDKGKCCGIYENRGFICRIYGSSELFPCPHGFAPEKPLSEEETRKLFAEYVKIKDEQEKLSASENQ